MSSLKSVTWQGKSGFALHLPRFYPDCHIIHSPRPSSPLAPAQPARAVTTSCRLCPPCSDPSPLCVSTVPALIHALTCSHLGHCHSFQCRPPTVHSPHSRQAGSLKPGSLAHAPLRIPGDLYDARVKATAWSAGRTRRPAPAPALPLSLRGSLLS